MDKLVLKVQRVEAEKSASVGNDEKIHTANLDLFYEVEVRDKNGKTISKTAGKSKSLVRNFALLIRGLMAGNIAGVVSGSRWNTKVKVADTAGNTFNFPALPSYQEPENAPSVMEASALERTDHYGIVVGSGTTPPTRDDYKLEAQIPDGMNEGQIIYGKTTVEDVNGNPPESVFRVIRTFTNDTPNTITVREIGIVVRAQGRNVLIARDVLDTPQDVPPAATLTVRYIFKITT